jgi:hypothetical protein
LPCLSLLAIFASSILASAVSGILSIPSSKQTNL